MFLNTLLSETTWYPTLFDTPLNALRSVAIWLTLAIFIAYTVALFLLKSEKRSRFLKGSIPLIIAYACGICVLALASSFIEDGIEKILFIPLLVLLCSIAGGAILLFFKRTKGIYILLSVWIIGSFFAVLICSGIHFASGEAAEKNWLTNDDVQSVALYIGGILAFLFLLGIAFFCGKKERQGFDAKAVTYAAICIAMSFALSFLRIARLPQGGSITPASLLPLMLYAYMFGVKKGVFAGFTYGLLQAFQDPAVLHPAQFLLDYPLAFAWIGLAGLFSQTKTLEKFPRLSFAFGATIAGLGRFFMHFLSGTFAFGVFAPEGTPAALYSFLYQAGYVLPDLAIAAAVGVLLFSSKTFIKEAKKFHLKRENA